MTSADDEARAVLRAYAGTLEPPPVAEVIARAERTAPAARHLPRGRLVLVGAAVVAVLGGAAVAARPADRDPTVSPGPVATTRGDSRMGPGCPPGLPLLDGPGTAVKPITARAGQRLTLTFRIDSYLADRPLHSFLVKLVGPERGTVPPIAVVSESEAVHPVPGQRRFELVLPVPAGLARGTYDIIGLGTFPSPSMCIGSNPPNPTSFGSEEGGVGRVVVK
jgi:hypothetical protein